MIGDLFGLLTRLRISRRPMDLENAAGAQHLFPIVGLVVGGVASLFAFSLNDLFGKDMALITGGLVLVALYSMTGILHTEGLADFADGIMASGTQEKKRTVMKDVHLGAAGVFATVLFLILFFAASTLVLESAGKKVSSAPLPWSLPFAFGFVISEVTGKLAMNASMFLGPSSHEGMGAVFVRRASVARLGGAILIACAVAFLTAGFMFVLVIIGIVGGSMVTMVSRKHFGGVSGDTFGAANEVGRLAALIGWVLLA